MAGKYRWATCVCGERIKKAVGGMSWMHPGPPPNWPHDVYHHKAEPVAGTEDVIT